MIIGPTLETERLLLRPPVHDDFEPFAAFMAAEATAKPLGGVLTRPAAWRQWACITGAWVLQGFSMFSVIEKATGRWIGRVGPWVPVDWPGTEVGWGIIADAQRRGYAREAATASIDWAFSTLGWSEVVHCITPDNLASIGVARALGSSRLRANVPSGPPFNETWDIYGQTRAAWLARRAAR